MRLAELAFSDLLIFGNGCGRLKGTPEGDQQLMPVPDACREDLHELHMKLANSFMSKGRPNDQGSQDVPLSIRLEHDGVRYRVADLKSVERGQSWFLRRLAETVPDLHSIGLPSYLVEWLDLQRQGLVLISGAQSSGKTTTASSLVAHWLKTRGGHAVTFECPAELPLDGSWGDFGHCFQIELLSEADLGPKIELAYRYARPNYEFFWEIKSCRVAVQALQAALGSTEQIVIATVFGTNLAAALERLSGFTVKEDNALHNLANSLCAIIHQDLRFENGKRVLTVPEFLLLPFNEGSKGIRAKLRKGEFHTLDDDIIAVKNRIRCYGVQGL